MVQGTGSVSRDRAVAGVPSPNVARVVRGGRHRERLEAVPLGEQREDRLVVPVLLKARVLARLEQVRVSARERSLEARDARLAALTRCNTGDSQTGTRL